MDVEFEEEDFAPVRRHEERQSMLTSLVLKTHVAKTPEAAQRVLLIGAVVIFVAALLVFFDLGKVTRPPTPVPTAQWP